MPQDFIPRIRGWGVYPLKPASDFRLKGCMWLPIQPCITAGKRLGSTTAAVIAGRAAIVTGFTFSAVSSITGSTYARFSTWK